MNRILELYGVATDTSDKDWSVIATQQHCPYLNRQCTKNRKSAPEITIGSCSVMVGQVGKAMMICPNRLLERGQIFLDSFHLLTRHEPGNQIHVVSEIMIPGGTVDYFQQFSVWFARLGINSQAINKNVLKHVDRGIFQPVLTGVQRF